MTRRKAISVLIALALIVLTIPTSKAVVDEWTTGTVDEDLFYASYKFEGVDMAYLQGKDMQIRSWFWFEGPVLDWGRYVTEAYLEVTTPSISATDPDAYMFIYGIPSRKGGTPSNAEDPSFINGPYTTNFYQVNLSSFVGSYVKHNITVTRIMREINQGHYFWDGHDIAFATLSPAREEAEERSVATIEAGYPAKLYIHYGAGPVDPTNQSAIWVNNTNGLDIYQYQVFENFYEDWTEVDPLNLIGTSALNPYRITFHDFGYEEYWDDPTYFRRDNLLNDTADYIEVRFKATLTDEEVPYHTADFDWIHLAGGGFSAELQHGCDTNDHYFMLGADVMTYGYGTCFFIDPIPPTRHGWFSFLWDYTLKQLTVRQYLTEPNSSAAWYTDFIAEDNESGVDINQIHWTNVYAPYSNLGSSFYDGLNWGYLENMLILVDFIPLYNGTFFAVDPETNETVVDDMPDLDSIVDWIETNYPDPEEPNPGDEWQDPDEGILTRLNFKLVVFIIGMVLFLGAPVYGFAERPEAATWILILFASIAGVALLWSLQTM